MTLSRLCKPLACLLAARRCVAAVEFALLAPIFVLMFAGIVDLGNALWTWCRLEEAVAAGTGFALVNGGVNASNVNSVNGQSLASDIAGIVANSAIVGSHTTPADVTVVVNNGPATTITSGVSANSGTATNADLILLPDRLVAFLDAGAARSRPVAPAPAVGRPGSSSPSPRATTSRPSSPATPS